MTKGSPLSTPCNRAYYTAPHQSHNANSDENVRKTNSAAGGSGSRDRRIDRPSLSSPASRHPSSLHPLLPTLQTLVRTQLTKRRGGVGDSGIDGAHLIDGIKLRFVINRSLVGPIDIGANGSLAL